MINRRLFLASGSTLALASASLMGCTSPQVSDYSFEKPSLNLEKYFSGVIDAWGIFTDRQGKVVKRFTAEIHGQWRNGQGILDEDFTYSDGKKEKRIWTLTDLGQGRFSGVAGDVIGNALGEVQGNAFHWQYKLAIPVGSQILEVDMDDWMYLMNERIMLNKTQMSKLGVHLGDVTLSFARRA